MTEALFEPRADGVYQPSVFTRGPWDPGLLHGGPVAALLGELLHDVAGADMQPVRLTVDLMRPVPLAPLTVTTAVLRTGRRLSVVEGTVTAGGKPVARATLTLLRAAPMDASALNPPLVAPPDGPQDANSAWGPPRTGESFVGGSMDFHFGELLGLGHGYAWLRLHRPVLPDREISPLARAAAAADVGNAVSSRRDPSLPRFSFVNADLSLSLGRLPEGEWVRLESRSRWEATGIGLVRSTMSDAQGDVGAVSNALVLAPMTSAAWD